MSVFRVNLNQGLGRTRDGYLDPSLNSSGYSIQRTIYLPGPNKITRRLFDGDTFTDVNYWKRFTTAYQDANIASIEVLTDDGSVWSDYTPDNTFPRSYHLSVATSSTYADNIVDVIGDNGNPAIFTQITVTGGSGVGPTFRFNGLTNATLSIASGTTQVFDKGDLSISLIEINNTQSGAATTTVDIFMSIKAVSAS